MEKQNVLIVAVLIALVAGFSGGYAMRGDQVPQGSHMMSDGQMMTNETSGMGHAMEEMMSALQGKTGDEFDKAFLAEMIMHHQGAVDMAKATLQIAKHQELKDMAQAIIAAQTAEIQQMQQWQKAWYNQ